MSVRLSGLFRGEGREVRGFQTREHEIVHWRAHETSCFHSRGSWILDRLKRPMGARLLADGRLIAESLEVLKCAGSGAPIFTHASSVAIFSAESLLSLGGICNLSSPYRTALINEALGQGSPGFDGYGPESPPASVPSRVSSNKPPLDLAAFRAVARLVTIIE